MCDTFYVSYILRGVNVPDAFDLLCTLGYCVHDFVLGRNRLVGDMLVMELHRVAQSIAFCIFDMALVCAVVF